MMTKSALLQLPDSSGSLKWSPLGVIKQGLSYTHIGLLCRFNSKFPTNIFAHFIIGTQTTPWHFLFNIIYCFTFPYQIPHTILLKYEIILM